MSQVNHCSVTNAPQLTHSTGISLCQGPTLVPVTSWLGNTVPLWGFGWRIGETRGSTRDKELPATWWVEKSPDLSSAGSEPHNIAVKRLESWPG